MAEADLTCPVCQDIFTEPVTLSCDHSFCRRCLQERWDQQTSRCCPFCTRRVSKDFLDVDFALEKLSISLKQKVEPQDEPKSPTQRTTGEVTLDPDTAGSWLRVSEDLRSVRHDNYRTLPETPRRFSKHPIVLGSRGFGSGALRWDVDVGDHPGWSLGVAKESVDRKHKIHASPKSGVWSLCHRDGTYTDGRGKPVRPQGAPLRRVGVKLDCDRGRVSFYDAERSTHLLTHSWSLKENMFPFFCVGPSGGARTKEIKVRAAHGAE